MVVPRIDAARAGVVVIDVQPLFVRTMAGDPEPVMSRLEQLFILSGRLRLPFLATFEHPTEVKGLLPDRLDPVFPPLGHRRLKSTFDCCAEPEIAQTLRQLAIAQVLLAGAETDVCVMQSTFGLIDLGFQVFLLEDCVFSSEPNTRPALDRIYRAGALPATYKMAYYELKRAVGDTVAFSRASAESDAQLLPPERLPPWQPLR